MLELMEWLTARNLTHGITRSRDGKCFAMVEGFEDCGTHHDPFSALMCALMKYLKHTQEPLNEHDTLNHPNPTGPGTSSFEGASIFELNSFRHPTDKS